MIREVLTWFVIILPGWLDDWWDRNDYMPLVWRLRQRYDEGKHEP
jgi:hypothetical protein